MKTTIKAKAILIAVAMFTVLSANAADVMPPVLTPGSTYEFQRVDGFTGIEKQHWTLTFKGMKNGKYAYDGINNEGNYKFFQNKDLNSFAVNKKTGDITEYQIFKWPLTVGEEHVYQDRIGPVTVSVQATEKVETKAGVFDTYRIKRNGSWYSDETNRRGPWQEVCWYAPSIGSFVKIESSYADLLGRRYNWVKTELIKYTTPDTQPFPAN
ncbi:hypothetical protein [Aquitalea magnusonii]|uniref:hypothetical protein n=1 Tax=Aquitalea magnusonii TaxID=332411 RepID=UPI000B5C7299|nr:hypothetical protein [Aquitalea magnusonii]